MGMVYASGVPRHQGFVNSWGGVYIPDDAYYNIIVSGTSASSAKKTLFCLAGCEQCRITKQEIPRSTPLLIAMSTKHLKSDHGLVGERSDQPRQSTNTKDRLEQSTGIVLERESGEIFWSWEEKGAGMKYFRYCCTRLQYYNTAAVLLY